MMVCDYEFDQNNDRNNLYSDSCTCLILFIVNFLVDVGEIQSRTVFIR
jgi:hypothetical protein